MRPSKRGWANTTNDHSIEAFVATFECTDPRTAYSLFKLTIMHSRLKYAIKKTVLENFEMWKKNKSHANLFWKRQQQALAVRNGKVIAGTSLVVAATDKLLEIIRSEASRVSLHESERTIFFSCTDVADSLSRMLSLCFYLYS